MEKGASQPWNEILQEVIGEGRLDGTALREFFRPLEEWLRQENLRNNEFVGWNYDGDYCKHRSVRIITDLFYYYLVLFVLLLARLRTQKNFIFVSAIFLSSLIALTRQIYKCTAVSITRLQLNCPTHRLHSR